MQNIKYQISIIGLGYVGLPLAIKFSQKYNVVGFDLDQNRIKQLKDGIDLTNELSKDDLRRLDNINLTYDDEDIKDSNIYIITVPTPVDINNKPDLTPLINACRLVGKNLSKDNIVIFESTVFPGCTVEICVPELEKYSKLKYNIDFSCGYSPERINPGDKKHVLTSIIKVVSASNDNALSLVDNLYKSIIKAGTHRASSIEVAEAAKVIENTQRDVNIALMNELALIFDKLNIQTSEVLKAASTKWNFLNFKPGLVGGHCIGVDPYYLTHKAAEVGYHPNIILAGRKINDEMGSYIAEKTISQLVSVGISPIGAKVSILGLTFKENCPDLRNSKVFSIIKRLEEFHCILNVSDIYAIKEEAKRKYDIDTVPLRKIKKQDAVILAVAHKEYTKFTKKDWMDILKPGGVIIDVKSIYSRDIFEKLQISYWSL